jgi:hypothetical protein
MSESAANDTAPVTTPIPYDTHVDNFFGVLCLFSFIFGTLGNMMALSYFSRKKRDVPTIIYTNVVLVDLIIALLTAPIGVSIFDGRKKSEFFQHQTFCDAWGFVWTSLSRMSVFLVGLLSVSRAYSLAFPFRIVRRRVIVGIIIAAFVIHSLGASLPLWWHDNHFFHPAVAACISFGNEGMPPEAVVATKVFDYVGLLIPVPVIIVSFVITVLQLAKRTSAGGGSGDNCKQNITVTIALFTGNSTIKFLRLNPLILDTKFACGRVQLKREATLILLKRSLGRLKQS